MVNKCAQVDKYAANKGYTLPAALSPNSPLKPAHTKH